MGYSQIKKLEYDHNTNHTLQKDEEDAVINWTNVLPPGPPTKMSIVRKNNKAYKVLTYDSMIVDESMLHKGVYEAEVPVLHRPTSIIESLEIKQRILHGIGSVDSQRAIANLGRCKLVYCKIKLV